MSEDWRDRALAAEKKVAGLEAALQAIVAHVLADDESTNEYPGLQALVNHVYGLARAALTPTAPRPGQR